MKLWRFGGYTRLEALLTGLLVTTVALVVWAVRPKGDGVTGPDPSTIEELRSSLLSDYDEDAELDGDEDPIPSIKGKTNMPVPGKGGGAKKPPAKPAAKKPTAKKPAAKPPAKKPTSTAKKPVTKKPPAAKPVAKKPPPRKPGSGATKPTARHRKLPGVKGAKIFAPPEVMEVFDALEGTEWSRETERKLLGAVTRWARDDVESAAEFALLIERRATRNSAINSSLSTWLSRSPQEAQAWFNATAEAEPFLVSDLTRSFYQRLSSKALPAAIEGVWDLPNAGMKKNALTSVSQRLMYLQREQELLDMHAAAASKEDRQVVTDVVIQNMARYEPEELGEWVFSMPDKTEQKKALGRLVSSWSWDHPSAAADWVAAEVPSDADRARQISTVVGNWVREDPAETAEWLLTLFPASRETDLGVDRFAKAVLPQDPAYAAAWSHSVVDNGRRWNLIEQVARKWKQASPGDARAYVNQTDLPGWRKDRLFK